MSETANPIQVSFNGEYSRRVQSRVDSPAYEFGLSKMENWLTTTEGPAMKAPGFLFVAAAAATATWMTEFRFNLTQSYQLGWEDHALRFFTNNAVIPGTVAIPYAAAETPYVWSQQSYDRQYFAHRGYAPQRLTRTGALTFAVDAVPFENGPFADLNGDDASTVQVTAGATTIGSVVTITASVAIFDNGRSNSFFRIEAKDFSDIPAWEPGINGVVVGTTKRRYEGKVFLAVQASSGNRTGTIPPTHDSGSEWDGDSVGQDINAKGPFGVRWQYLYDIFGIFKITAVGGAGLTATATVIRRPPDSVTSVPSPFWQHGAFSATEGWPGVVFIWQQRLCWMQDFYLNASVAGRYLNHQAFTSNGLLEVDLAFRKRMSVSDPVLWARPDRDAVLFGTATGEYLISLINPADGVSANNLKITEQGSRGSDGLQTLKIGGEVIWIERAGYKIRSAEYAFDRDRYPSINLTSLARHITGPGAKQMFWCQAPEQFLGVVRSDGQIAFHDHDPEQNKRGWCRRVLAANGQVLSAISTPSPDGKRDDVWAIVSRDGIKSYERMMPFWDEDRMGMSDAFFVDSGVVYNGAPVTTIVAPHLAGRTVRLLCDGYTVPDIVVAADGTIGPLAIPASHIVAGLGYKAEMNSLRFEQRDRYGQTNQGKKKRVVHMMARLIATGQLSLGALGATLQELIFRKPADAQDQALPLFDGETIKVSVGGVWGRDGVWTAFSDDALPAMISAIMPHVELTEI